jgi:hypothetical protein
MTMMKIDFREIVGYTDPTYSALDSTTSYYEFLSYQECCRSLNVKGSIQKFMRYNAYYKEIMNDKL